MSLDPSLGAAKRELLDEEDNLYSSREPSMQGRASEISISMASVWDLPQRKNLEELLRSFLS